jgi:hypothetical protein
VTGKAWRDRATDAIVWLTPIVFLFWIFQEGLDCWFVDDDFAWLGLIRRVGDPHALLMGLFAPAAQGTIRPWSERGFFLLFETLFGMDNFPLRIAAFTTMALNIALLTWIMRRITGSRLAAFVAGMVWAANAALMTVMTWSSAYNEAMCAGFLLGALALFIRYAETGRRGYWWGQLAVFALGFGALEINVVYPALAASYALFVAPAGRRRPLLLSVAPLFAVSVAYFVLHSAVAPVPHAGPYAVHFDGRVFQALALYGKWSLLPAGWEGFGHSPGLGKVIVWTLIAALGSIAAIEWRKRRTLALFFVAWYLATLAPVLVLPDHHSDYYLTIPLIGFGMLAGWATARAVLEFGTRALVAALPLAAYFIGMVPMSQAATRWALQKTEPVRTLVLGVEAARRTHPGKSILLDRIPASVYTDSIAHGAFYPMKIDDVYLTPESKDSIRVLPDTVDPEKTVLEPEAAWRAIANDEVVIYSLSGNHLRNVTEAYERSAPNRFSDRLPSRLDAGNPLYSWLLGPTWLGPESGVRWMPGTAEVRLRGPDSPGRKLVLKGFYPQEQPNDAPRHLIVSVDGIEVGNEKINGDFRRTYSLPESSIGKAEIAIGIRVQPVARVGGQDYGAVFGTISIHPN